MQVVDMQQPEQPKPSSAVAVRGLGVATVLLLVLGVLGLLVVEPDDDARVVGGTPLAAVLGAAERSASQSARMSMRMEIDTDGGGGLGAKAGMTMDGVVDFGARRLDFTMKVADLFELKMLSDGTTVYMKMPAALMAEADNGPPTPWVSVPFAVLAEAGVGGGMNTDPTSMFKLMRDSGLLTDVSEVGRADVRGVSTTQYRASLDLVRFIKEFAGKMMGQDAPSDEDLAEIRKVLGTPTMEVFVDDEGLVRRQVIRMQIDDPERSSAFHMSTTMTMDIYDYGVEFQVTPPPANEVTHYDSAEEFESVTDGD